MQGRVRALLCEGSRRDVPDGRVAGGGQRQVEEDPLEPAHERDRAVRISPAQASEQRLMTPPQKSGSHKWSSIYIRTRRRKGFVDWSTRYPPGHYRQAAPRASAGRDV